MEETNNVSSAETANPTQTDSPSEVAPVSETGSSLRRYTIIAVVAVVAIIVVFVFTQRHSDSGISADQVVATVNGTNITGSELTTSMAQITASAQLQGVDTTDPLIQADIQSQAVNMLVNTELLEQEAAARGIAITAEQVTERIEQLTQEIGGRELLEQRMSDLGIDAATLEVDIASELAIQALLDELFAEEAVEVTEEEVVALYDSSVAGVDAAPDLATVRLQIEQQILAGKEQAAIDGFISRLRESATISVAE